MNKLNILLAVFITLTSVTDKPMRFNPEYIVAYHPSGAFAKGETQICVIRECFPVKEKMEEVDAILAKAQKRK